MNRLLAEYGRRLVLSLFVVVSAIGCSKNPELSDRFHIVDPITEIPKGVSWTEYITHFPVYDDEGQERPISPSGRRGHYPLGVLITRTDAGIGYCSGSHAVKGYAVVNAHCVEYPGQANSKVQVKDLYFLFWDKFGKKRITQPREYGFVGSRNDMDIAVLKLTDNASDAWEPVGTDIVDAAVDADGNSIIEKNPPNLFTIKAWVFDPIQRPDPEMGRTAMRFSPKTCTASRTSFELLGHTVRDGVVKSSKIVLKTPTGLQPNDTKMHFVFDGCSQPIKKGNSGGLVTQGTPFGPMIGVLHWKWSSEEVDPKHEYTVFSIKGNKSYENPVHVQREGRKPVYLFNTGTTFESVLKLIPTLFGVSGPTPVKPTT